MKVGKYRFDTSQQKRPEIFDCAEILSAVGDLVYPENMDSLPMPERCSYDWVEENLDKVAITMKCLEKLQPIEQELINYRYAMYRTQRETARLVNYDQEMVVYIEQRALKKLKLFFLMAKFNEQRMKADLTELFTKAVELLTEQPNALKICGQKLKCDLEQNVEICVTVFKHPQITEDGQLRSVFKKFGLTNRGITLRIKKTLLLVMKYFESEYYELFNELLLYGSDLHQNHYKRRKHVKATVGTTSPEQSATDEQRTKKEEQ